MEDNRPTALVIPLYEKELNEIEEKTVGNVIAVLKSNNVTDEMTRARVLSKSKAFIRDVFNAGVEAGIL